MTSTYIGRQNGKLTIQSTFVKPREGKRPYLFAVCLCDCGETKEMNVTTFPFAKSCGCAKAADPNTKSKTRLYSVWSNMISRTTKPKHPHFDNYGGRGIIPDPDWLIFENFKTWAEANGYADHLSLERLDNDQGYHPTNCVWIRRSEQNKNRRTNKMNQTKADALRAEYARGSVSMATLAERYGVSQSLVSNIIHFVAWKPPASVCRCCGK